MTVTQRNTPREKILEHVFRTNYVPLLAYVQKLTLGDRGRAEDIVQETMMRAWQHADDLILDKDAALPWLYTVAKRISIDVLRSRALRPQEVTGDVLAVQADSRDSIDEAITAVDIEAVLDKLPPGHRAVLVNLYLRGRTSSETAQVMGIPTGTVKTRCFHALRALRKVLAVPAAV